MTTPKQAEVFKQRFIKRILTALNKGKKVYVNSKINNKSKGGWLLLKDIIKEPSESFLNYAIKNLDFKILRTTKK